MPEDRAQETIARRRLRGFGRHLVGYFAVIFVLAVVNMISTSENPWFVWPMVGYGGVLAVHAAYAMGLFEIFSRHDTASPPRNG